MARSPRVHYPHALYHVISRGNQRQKLFKGGYGGNGGSTVNRKLGQYYHSTSAGTLMVVDTKTKKGLQQIPTSNGARSLGVSLANNRVYVATTTKELACRGCIVVYAPE